MLCSENQHTFVWQIVTLSDRTEYTELFFDVIDLVFNALLPTSLAHVSWSLQRSYRSHLLKRGELREQKGGLQFTW